VILRELPASGDWIEEIYSWVGRKYSQDRRETKRTGNPPGYEAGRGTLKNESISYGIVVPEVKE
jgi:hypothetical protein